MENDKESGKTEKSGGFLSSAGKTLWWPFKKTLQGAGYVVKTTGNVVGAVGEYSGKAVKWVGNNTVGRVPVAGNIVNKPIQMVGDGLDKAGNVVEGATSLVDNVVTLDGKGMIQDTGKVAGNAVGAAIDAFGAVKSVTPVNVAVSAGLEVEKAVYGALQQENEEVPVPLPNAEGVRRSYGNGIGLDDKLGEVEKANERAKEVYLREGGRE